jgi:hypothetical protein
MKKAFQIELFDQMALLASVTPFNGNQDPFKNVLGALALPPYECKTVIKEQAYVDKDYQDEFAAFYCKAFKTYDSRCVRWHFFDCDIPANTTTEFAQFAPHYLGYMVIRPTDLQRVGRTVLRPALTDRNRQFFHCTATCHTNILGQVFNVTGMPFIQQDTQVGACAQASIWMLARYMSRKFGYREYLPSEINNLAKANIAVGRPLPAERGLNSWQMLDALKGMGIPALIYSRGALKKCSPHIEKVFSVDKTATEQEQTKQLYLQDTVKLADITYRYIESGLPVIIGPDDHALVGIGHTYDPAKIATVAIERIPAFYVNNDNTGPYREMPIFTTSATDYSFNQVRSVIPVLPHEVTLRGEDAELMAREYVDGLLDAPVMAGAPPVKFKDYISKQNPKLAGTLNALEYRTFLQPSVAFQSFLREDMNGGRLEKQVGQELLLLDYPKYIWITEVSSSTLLNHPASKDRMCVGRIVSDSTAPANTKGVIASHVADFLQLIGRDSAVKAISTYHPGSTPFGHKVLQQA